MKVVIVGFKVSEENSVYYKKKEIQFRPDSATDVVQGINALGGMLFDANEKGADFVSVRFQR